ncbi:MAG: hypothetical protein ACSW8H_10585, partial [bacterium]
EAKSIRGFVNKKREPLIKEASGSHNHFYYHFPDQRILRHAQNDKYSSQTKRKEEQLCRLKI